MESEDTDPADTWRTSDVGEGGGAPCLRVVVTESDKLNAGTVFVVTRIGADIGRCVRLCVRLCVSSAGTTAIHPHVSAHPSPGTCVVRQTFGFPVFTSARYGTHH